MNAKPILFVIISVLITAAWLVGADAFIDRFPDGPAFRHHQGFAAVCEDAGISLYTLPYVGFKIYDAIHRPSTTINRNPLFILALVQIIPLFVATWFALQGSLLSRRLAVGYALFLISSSAIGFCVLHWILRPAYEKCCP